jgi:hypothetical protein
MDRMSLIEAALRRGALHRLHFEDLEEGELERRMLLMRPDVQTLIANGLTSEQKATVLAALRGSSSAVISTSSRLRVSIKKCKKLATFES